MRKLYAEVRRGDPDARNQLFRSLTEDRRVSRTIQSLLYEHSVVEPEEVKAEFWRGVVQRMAVVRHDLGDPVLHLIKAGVWQVKSVVRTELNRRVVQHCISCGRVNQSYNFSKVCDKCKAPVENIGRTVDITDVDTPGETVGDGDNYTIVRTARPLSRTQVHVLELLVQACIDGHDHPQSAISQILRISRQRVCQHIAKIRPYLTID